MAMGKMKYSRFYVLLAQLASLGDRDDVKYSMVMQYTNGRTSHVSEMTPSEYAACCDAMESMSGRRERLRKQRSICLKLMQRNGIDTTDWARVNAFCSHPRIAGKPFANITIDELSTLEVKLRAILRKGGLSSSEAQEAEEEPKHETIHQTILVMDKRYIN